MINESVLYKNQGGIARIVLNRPQQKNAFNTEMLHALGSSLDAAAQDRSVKICIISGQGDCFCAGADVASMSNMNEDLLDEFYQATKIANETIRKVIRFSKPLLTAVNGPALGGGTCLALAGDVVIVKENANFGFVFSRFNLVPDFGAHYIITRLSNSIRARELILSGKIFTAPEAYEYGLISKVVPEANFDDAVQEQAQQMLKWQTDSAVMAKTILEKAEAGCDLDTILDLEARSQIVLFSSKTTRNLISNFFEKSSEGK